MKLFLSLKRRVEKLNNKTSGKAMKFVFLIGLILTISGFVGLTWRMVYNAASITVLFQVQKIIYSFPIYDTLNTANMIATISAYVAIIGVNLMSISILISIAYLIRRNVKNVLYDYIS
jgi:hypothetical protein